MKIDVYDSFATNQKGQLMHFDVMVPVGTEADLAHHFGRHWLRSIGETADVLQQSQCHFCHSAAATPEVVNQIQQHGYFILQMEGCPAPY